MTGGYSEYDGEVELRRLGSPKIELICYYLNDCIKSSFIMREGERERGREREI